MCRSVRRSRFRAPARIDLVDSVADLQHLEAATPPKTSNLRPSPSGTPFAQRTNMRWSSAVFLLCLAATGCYRTTSVDVAEVERIEPLADEKLAVRYTNGTTETFAADRARVELRTGAETELELRSARA